MTKASRDWMAFLASKEKQVETTFQDTWGPVEGGGQEGKLFSVGLYFYTC